MLGYVFVCVGRKDWKEEENGSSGGGGSGGGGPSLPFT